MDLIRGGDLKAFILVLPSDHNVGVEVSALSIRFSCVFGTIKKLDLGVGTVCGPVRCCGINE